MDTPKMHPKCTPSGLCGGEKPNVKPTKKYKWLLIRYITLCAFGVHFWGTHNIVWAPHQYTVRVLCTPHTTHIPVPRNFSVADIRSWGCVFNSFDELEGEYLDHLRKEMGHGRVWGVGPISLAGGDEKIGRVNLDKNSGDGVLSWLDGCPAGSVVYVCFGSQKLLKKEQMEALAFGLERSGIRFVWVVKSVSTEKMADGYGVLPDGFEDRVSGRGMVIKGWASQVSILSHLAVGGFLSHCGWNSLLEGVVAGVMILAWPMEADQFVNARLLVEDMGAAVRVGEGGDSVPDSIELARIVAESMSGNTAQKVKAKELRDKAFQAVKIGGSSCKGFEGLVTELAQLGR